MTNQVQPVTIKLDIKGGEQVAKLKSSFRDLTKTVGQTDSGIEAARKSINDYVKSANNSEAVIRGQIKAFEGLREQAAMGGKVYRELSNNITDLKAQLNGSTSAIDAQRKSLLETAGSAKVTQAQLLSVANALSTLQKQTVLGSKAFVELGADIANLEGKIVKVKTEQQELSRLNLAANQAATGGAAATRLQIKAINEKVAAIRDEKIATEELSRQSKIRLGMQSLLDRPGDVPFRSREYIEQAVASSLLGENITKMFGAKELQTAIDVVKQSVAELQNEIEIELGGSARRAFQEMARKGRESARSLAIAFSGPEFERIFANLEKNVGELPNTTAGLSQRLQELERVLTNTARGGDNYVRVALEIARVQREASAATQGLGAALVDDLASGVAVRNQKNLREAIVQLQAEMSELNTETAEGSAKYAENAAQVNRLQKELDGIANSYRSVSDAARQAGMATGGGSLNPFSASGARNPAFMREREKQEMEQIAQLQQELNGLEGEYVDSVRSALETIQNYQQKRHDDFMRQVDERISAEQEASAKAIENTKREAQALDDQFNTMLQQRKAAASAMGIGGRTDISSLYEGIIGLSTADISRQQEMMGKSATEVFNDIATAFSKGGRAVDLKAKSTDIGDSIAEGVVDGASDSGEINKGAKTFAQKLIAAYKSAFGIKSPSKETEQKIGVPLGLGIIKGLLSAFRSNKGEVQKEIEQIAEPVLARSRQPRRLIGTVNEPIATFTGYGTRARAATPGYRPLQTATNLDTEIERMFNRFRVNIAAVTTDAEIYYNLLQALPTSRITTDLADIASRRARASEVPGFLEAQRVVGPGELERAIASAFSGFIRELRIPASQRIREERFAGPKLLPPAVENIAPSQQERITRAYERSAQRALSVLSEDAFRGTGRPGLPAANFGFIADPTRISRLSGMGRALPPAINVSANAVDEGSRDLRESVRNLFDRITQGVRSAFSGFGGGSGGGRGAGGGGGRSFFDIGGESFGHAGDLKFVNDELKKFGNLGDASTYRVQALGASLKNLQDILDPLGADFNEVNKAITDQSMLIDRELQKRERQRGRRRMSPMQMTQAAGAAISGGIFGGPEGFLGGVGGALVGGVGGAFAGAAIGAQIGGLRKTLGEFADYAAGIQRLQIALKGVAGGQVAFNSAIGSARDVVERFNVPQETAIQGITRLTAAVKGAGGGIPEASAAFKNVTAAIIATGGGAEQVEGAITALVQIFSKGKVSMEEINQIAERLPGTFNIFADAAGKTGPELLKGLQKGEIGLNDLMSFVRELGARFEGTASTIGDSSQAAGARLRVAFNDMRISVGKALQPLGAEIQSVFANLLKDSIPALTKLANATVFTMRAIGAALMPVVNNFDLVVGSLVGLGSALAVGKVVAYSKQLGNLTTVIKVARLEVVQLIKTTAAFAKLKGALALLINPWAALAAGIVAASVGLYRAATANDRLNKSIRSGKVDLDEASEELERLYERVNLLSARLESQSNNRLLQSLRRQMLRAREDAENTAEAIETLIYKPYGKDFVGPVMPGMSPADEAKNAFDAQKRQEEQDAREREQRATSLLNAIEQRENAIAQARIQLEEQAANIRKQAIEQAKQLEESIAKQRLDKERQIEDLRRQLAYTEEDIALGAEEARFVAGGGDPEVFRVRREIIEFARQQKEEEISLDRQLRDEQAETQKAIEKFKSNNAKAIMEANAAHAKQIGRIQQEYARSVAKIVEEGTGKAGKRLEAAGIIVAQEIKKAEAQATAIAMGYSFGRGGSVTGPSYNVLSPNEKSALGAARNLFLQAEKAIDRANQSLSEIPTATAIAAPGINRISTSFNDLNSSLAANARRFQGVRNQIKGISRDLSGAKISKKVSEIFAQQGAGTFGRQRAMQSEAQRRKNVLRYREEGYSANVAQQLVEQEAQIASELANLGAARDEALKRFPGQQEEIRQNFVEMSEAIRGSHDAVRDLTIALDNIPTEIKLRSIIVDLKEQLRELVDPANQIKGAATAIGDAFATSFGDAISGAKTAKEALADFFQSVGSYFLDMAKQIIAKMIQIAIINAFVGLLPGGPAAGGGGGGGGLNLEAMTQYSGIGANTRIPGLANGGPVTGGSPYIVGERGPELFVPNRSGTIVPNSSLGGANIVVNVDASGTNAQGDAPSANQLGKAIGAAVQAELIKQQRPGGLLAS